MSTVVNLTLWLIPFPSFDQMQHDSFEYYAFSFDNHYQQMLTYIIHEYIDNVDFNMLYIIAIYCVKISIDIYMTAISLLS